MKRRPYATPALRTLGQLTPGELAIAWRQAERPESGRTWLRWFVRQLGIAARKARGAQ